jgi:hypothetical protein
MESIRHTNWQQLYRLAVFESDPEKLPLCIEEACEAIRWRVSELWDLGAVDSCERSQLDAASYFLGLLRMIAARKKRSVCSALGRRLASGQPSGKKVAKTIIPRVPLIPADTRAQLANAGCPKGRQHQHRRYSNAITIRYEHSGQLHDLPSTQGTAILWDVPGGDGKAEPDEIHSCLS